MPKEIAILYQIMQSNVNVVQGQTVRMDVVSFPFSFPYFTTMLLQEYTLDTLLYLYQKILIRNDCFLVWQLQNKRKKRQDKEKNIIRCEILLKVEKFDGVVFTS